MYRSFIWDFLGRVGSQLIGFFIGISLARLLNPDDFGSIGIGMTLIPLSKFIVSAGLNSSIIQRDHISSKHLASAFTFSFLTSLVLCLIIFFLSPLVTSYFNEPGLTVLSQALSIILIFYSYSYVQIAYFQKKLLFKKLLRYNLISVVASGLISLLLAFSGFGIWSLGLKLIFEEIFLCFCFFLFSPMKPRFFININALKDLWKFGLNMFYSGFLNTAYEQISNIIILKMYGTFEMGLYNRAKSLNNLVIRYSSQSISTVSFPTLSAMQNEKQKMIFVGLKTETLVAFFSFALLGLFYTIAEDLILVLLGQKWYGVVPIFKILCLSGFVFPISSATLSMLKASGDSSTFLKLELMKKIIGIIGLTIGFSFGLVGFLYSLIFTGLIVVFLNMYYTGKSVGVSVFEQLKCIYKYLLIAIISFYFVKLINFTNSSKIISLLSDSSLYLVSYFLLNVLLKSEGLSILLKKIKSTFK